MGGTDERRSFLVAVILNVIGRTVLCVLVVTTPTYGQTQATAKAADSPTEWAYPETIPLQAPVDDGKPARVPTARPAIPGRSSGPDFIAPVCTRRTMGHYRIS